MEEAREKRKTVTQTVTQLKEWNEHCSESICGKYVNYIYFKCFAGRPLPW